MKRDEPILMSQSFPEMMDGIACVYLIWCYSSGKAYVGSAVNWGRRMRKHRSGLRGNYHDNRHLQSAYNLYGERQFGIFMLDSCTVDELLVKEQEWIDTYKSASRESGYNLCPVAGRMIGLKFTDEQRKNVSLGVRRAYIERPELRLKSSKAHTGLKQSPETIAKVVAVHAMPFSLISPDGVLHNGTNRAEFCRKHGLNSGAISDIINGKRGHHTHKGWSVAKP